jgi:putative glutamine amidotransferase
MSFLTATGIQDPEDASLSDRLALWIIEQQQQHDSAQHARPRIGILAPMGYARDGGWPVYASDAPTAYAILEGYDPFQLLSDERAFLLLFGLMWPVMRELDGLILTGGADLYSCLYGPTPHPQAETPDMWRDVWERFIALLAWLLCIPTLGICRGMQLMNVVLGGTIYQDLRAQWPKERLPLLHHQAVETLAPDLALSATSPDGVIEAFEETSCARWWLGVQFHPEWMTHLTWSLGLFAALVEAWVSRYWRPESRQLRLQTATLPRNWWWSFLVERGQESKRYLLLTLLASSAAVILGAVWGAVPTAFAGGMLQSHELDKLGWLLAGQIVALVIGVCWFKTSRGVVGFSERLLPPSREARARTLALSMLVVMGGSLVALGLPFLQAPWWLAVSLASYTLAAAVWSILLPRLRPSVGTLISAQRHLLLGQGRSLPDTLQVRYGRAREERVTLFLMTAEGALIACFTPVVGFLIGVYSSFDRVLVIFGLCSLLGLTLLALVSVLRSLKQPQRLQIARSIYKKSASCSWRPGYSPVRLAW